MCITLPCASVTLESYSDVCEFHDCLTLEDWKTHLEVRACHDYCRLYELSTESVVEVLQVELRSLPRTGHTNEHNINGKLLPRTAFDCRSKLLTFIRVQTVVFITIALFLFELQNQGRIKTLGGPMPKCHGGPPFSSPPLPSPALSSALPSLPFPSLPSPLLPYLSLPFTFSPLEVAT